MLASVLIACYNHEAYIEECLESVYRQSFSEIELIVIDDHSPDASFAIAQRIIRRKSFSNRFASVTLARNPANLGAHFTWNRALSLAKGDTIFLLNSDDVFLPNRVELFIERRRDERLFFAFSRVEPIDENGKSVRSHQFPTRLRHGIHPVTESGRPLSWAFLDAQIAASTGNFVFSAELAKRVGWLSNLRYCHDWDFALRAVTVVEPKFVENDCYLYRLHSTNSFRSLGAVAESESRACIASYCKHAIAGRPRNRTCLSPSNFGDAFYELMNLHPAFAYWVKQLYAPYTNDHRTVDKNEWTLASQWR